MKKINIDNNKINKYLKILITIQFIIFPILDMIRTTNFRHVEFLGISKL